MAERTRASVIALAVAAGLLAVPAAQDQLPRPTFRTEPTTCASTCSRRATAPGYGLAAIDFESSKTRPHRKSSSSSGSSFARLDRAKARSRTPKAQSRQAIQDPRSRVFVLFLDPTRRTVRIRAISQTLVNVLNRLIGPDDYVGVMVPPMKLSDVTFARRTVAIENLLRRDWWGKRDSLLPADEIEDQYAYCYQSTAPAIGQEMILRHREQQTFDALEDLVVSIRHLREERKAVLAIINGWLISRTNLNLVHLSTTAAADGGAARQPPIGIDPRSGDSTADPNNMSEAALRKCELDRQVLSTLDHESRLRTIIEEANRSNTSFYPVDPRGLVVFDEGIVPSAQVGPPSANPTLRPEVETSRLRAREDGLRRLAEGTDGTAVVGTNMIREALRRIVEDLNSYYLPDTRQESWTESFTRSGAVSGRSVSVRARRNTGAANPTSRGGSPDSRGSGAFRARRPCRRRIGRLEDRQLGARSRVARSGDRRLAKRSRRSSSADILDGWRGRGWFRQRSRATLTTAAGEIVTSARRHRTRYDERDGRRRARSERSAWRLRHSRPQPGPCGQRNRVDAGHLAGRLPAVGGCLHPARSVDGQQRDADGRSAIQAQRAPARRGARDGRRHRRATARSNGKAACGSGCRRDANGRRRARWATGDCFWLRWRQPVMLRFPSPALGRWPRFSRCP
jgi:hypothetical protein